MENLTTAIFPPFESANLTPSLFLPLLRETIHHFGNKLYKKVNYPKVLVFFRILTPVRLGERVRPIAFSASSVDAEEGIGTATGAAGELGVGDV